MRKQKSRDARAESAAILDELRAEARAYGFDLDLRVYPGPAPPAEREQLAADVPVMPKRAQEILFEILNKHYLRMGEAVNEERRVHGQKPVGHTAKLAKRKADFEKAYYGKFRRSEKARRVVDLLRGWHGSQVMEQNGWCSIQDNARIPLLAPFLDTVRILDTEFFKLLAQATEMLETRIRSSKDSTIGTGDTHLDLCLLQYGMGIAGAPMHTARELNQQFVSKFRAISVEKLRVKCRDLGIPLKPDKRGPKRKI